MIAVSQAVAKDRFASRRACQSRSSTSSARWPAASQPSAAPPAWHVMVASSLDASGASMRWSAGRSPPLPAPARRPHIVGAVRQNRTRRAADDGAVPTAVPGTMPNIRQPREHATEQAALAGASHPIYMALGALLLGAATLNLATCTVDDFDADWLDAELGLAERGWRSVVMVGLGQHAASDIEPPSLPCRRSSSLTRL